MNGVGANGVINILELKFQAASSSGLFDLHSQRNLRKAPHMALPLQCHMQMVRRGCCPPAAGAHQSFAAVAVPPCSRLRRRVARVLDRRCNPESF